MSLNMGLPRHVTPVACKRLIPVRVIHSLASWSTLKRPVLASASRNSHIKALSTQDFSVRKVSTATNPATRRLAEKVAVITGSSAGLGRATALRFAREGAKVVCADLQPLSKVDFKDEMHIATHDAIMKEGGTGVFVKTDVREPEQVEELVHQAVKTFGRLDIFVNNAGIAPDITHFSESGVPAVLHQVPVSTYDQNMRTNARGAFLGCKYAISQMLKQKVGPTGSRGWIVNIASSAGLVGVVGLPTYAVSKGAVVQLTRQAAVEYGQHKIHVNAICPGLISTGLSKPYEKNDAIRAAMYALHPWGTFGNPEDIAGAAVFLASEDAAFVTGAILPVDGGFVAQ